MSAPTELKVLPALSFNNFILEVLAVVKLLKYLLTCPKPQATTSVRVHYTPQKISATYSSSRVSFLNSNIAFISCSSRRPCSSAAAAAALPDQGLTRFSKQSRLGQDFAALILLLVCSAVLSGKYFYQHLTESSSCWCSASSFPHLRRTLLTICSLQRKTN